MKTVLKVMYVLGCLLLAALASKEASQGLNEVFR